MIWQLQWTENRNQVNLIKLAWKNSRNHIKWTRFWRIIANVNHCVTDRPTENIFLDLWLWIIRCRRTRPKRRRLRLFFSAASKLNFGDNDVIVKKKQKENSFWYLSSLRYDTTTTMKMKNIIYSRLNKIYTANVDNFLLRSRVFLFHFVAVF